MSKQGENNETTIKPVGTLKNKVSDKKPKASNNTRKGYSAGSMWEHRVWENGAIKTIDVYVCVDSDLGMWMAIGQKSEE